MTKVYIHSRIIFALIFMVCLSAPDLAFSEEKVLQAENSLSTTSSSQHAFITAENKQTPQEKNILSGDRDLGAFFAIGLIINLAMMSLFAVWAVGQWRKNNKTNKS